MLKSSINPPSHAETVRACPPEQSSGTPRGPTGHPLAAPRVGRHLITPPLRADARAKVGPQFSEREFNDAILYAGSLPYKYLRDEVLARFG